MAKIEIQESGGNASKGMRRVTITSFPDKPTFFVDGILTSSEIQMIVKERLGSKHGGPHTVAADPPFRNDVISRLHLRF